MSGLLRPAKELQHIVVTEAAVTALADAEEGELAPITEPLHGVDVQVQHLGDFRRGEQLTDLVHNHRCSKSPHNQQRYRCLAPRSEDRCGERGS